MYTDGGIYTSSVCVCVCVCVCVSQQAIVTVPSQGFILQVHVEASVGAAVRVTIV